jgi:hypothetical protein
VVKYLAGNSAQAKALLGRVTHSDWLGYTLSMHGRMLLEMGHLDQGRNLLRQATRLTIKSEVAADQNDLVLAEVEAGYPIPPGLRLTIAVLI